MPSPPSPAFVRRRLAWATVVPLGLAGGLLGAVAIAPILRLRNIEYSLPVPTWELVVYGIVTTLMVMAALALALRRKNVGPASSGFCILFGWLNCPACLLAYAASERFYAADGVLFAIVTSIVGGLLIGLFVALPLGFLYGLVAALPMEKIGALRARPTFDAIPRATRIVALTVLPSALFGAFVAFCFESERHANVPVWMALALAGAALLALGKSHFDIKRAGAWLDRVAAGRVSDWALVPTAGAALPDLIALPPEREAPHGGTVLVHSPGGSATYRTTENRVFWAVSEGPAHSKDADG